MNPETLANLAHNRLRLRAIAKILRRHRSFLARAARNPAVHEVSFAEFDRVQVKHAGALAEAGRLWSELTPNRAYLVFDKTLWWFRGTGMRPNGRVEVLSRTRDRASRAIEKKKPRATKSDLLRAIAKILQRHTSFLAQVRTDLPKTKASFAEFDGLYAAQTRELIEAGRLWLKLRPRRPWLVFEDVLWWWNDTGLHPLVPVEVIGVEPGKEHVNHYGPMEVHRAD